ncbi:ROK family transcriptional regulator [Tengunoibacter tsumagoiensis]|uniref:Sugar kinase n=1 Tax=Tengunoibacter tsumagoiensis TaxID=2014871 RepID=A0A401ZTH7_9CHLR|nr:ROK family transcriptional regulator [Tengunoibacter tsumagoiensis]GCE10199.1 sugar kinase [Tengunoibacter tsumagoiensis]
MNTTRAGSKGLIRDMNRSRVLNIIASHGPISRVEVARQSGLTAATITNIMNDFINADLVWETATEESSGGRPPILLRINPSAGYVIGVKLREYKVIVVLCDLECHVLYQTESPLPIDAQPYQVVDIIAADFEKCLHENQINHQDVLGMGVGVSGLVDEKRGILRYSNFFRWQNVELGPALEFKTRVPVIIENDVNMLTLAEYQYGSGRISSTCILVSIGHGVGMGLIIGGELFRGAYGSAAEFGHITMDSSPTAPPCTCGKRGCLEAIISDYGIIYAALGGELGFSDEQLMQTLINRARTGDTQIQAIFQRAGEVLGIALANLVNLFDPAQILIAGEGLRDEDLLLKPARAMIPQHTFGHIRTDVPLITVPSDNRRWAQGAASVFLHEVFRPPIYETGKILPIDNLLQRAHTRTRKK